MYNKEILDNGLRIVTEQMPHVKSCSVGILVAAGVKNEKETQLGISHFVEHMCFKGTKKRTAKEIASTIEKVGGYLNAATEKEYVYYYCKILGSNLYLALDVLIDMVKNSVFHPQDIENEKKVVLEEIRAHNDSPTEQVHEMFTQTVWRGAKLGRNILGNKETISRLTRDEIIDYVNENYIPSNMIIAAAGDVSHKEFVKKIKRYFNEKPANTKSSNKVRDYKLDFNSEVVIKNKDTEQVYFCIGTRGSTQTDEDRYVLSVLGTMLGIGMSSRLFQIIREKKGLVYSIYAFAYSYLRNGLFGICAGCKKENLLKTIRLVINELKKLKKGNLTTAELNSTKEQLKGSLMLGLESTISRLDKLMRAEFYLNREVTLDEMISEINKVKKDDVIEKACQIFNKEITCACLGPIDDKYKGKIEEIVYDI